MMGRAPRLMSLYLMVLAGSLSACQSVPEQHAPLPPSPTAPTQAPAAATTEAVVEASVTAAPQEKTRVVYRVAFTLPKGVDSISVVLPDLASTLPAPAPAGTAGEPQECSDGFFSCSKLVAEAVSAVVAAIVALIGLVALLRKQ